MRSKYLNPFTDFGFKKLFGEEASKPLLIDFLNAVLQPSSPILELNFRNTEALPEAENKRRAVFDLYCQTASGERIIVELQQAKQNFFKERTIYYSTFPIREQAEKGPWNYDLKAVYCVGVLDFVFNDYGPGESANRVRHHVKLRDDFGQVFYDKLTYIYLEIPNFQKSLEELETRLDKWLYFLKNLEDIEQIPSIFHDSVFEDAFVKAALSNLAPEEEEAYESSLKIMRDWHSVFETKAMEAEAQAREAEAKGHAAGHAAGIQEQLIVTVRNGAKMGLERSVLAQLTSLNEALIDEILLTYGD